MDQPLESTIKSNQVKGVNSEDGFATLKKIILKTALKFGNQKGQKNSLLVTEKVGPQWSKTKYNLEVK